MVTDIPRIPE